MFVILVFEILEHLPYVCFVFFFVTLFCQFLVASWSPARKGLILCSLVHDVSLCFSYFSIWCPGSDVVYVLGDDALIS